MLFTLKREKAIFGSNWQVFALNRAIVYNLERKNSGFLEVWYEGQTW